MMNTHADTAFHSPLDIDAIRPGSYIASPIGDDAEHDCDLFVETGALMFLALVLSLIGYGLWVFFA